MICTITSCIAKVAANGNHYLDIVAQPADAWSEPITYRLFGSAERCAALSATPPKTINLGRVQAKVRSYAGYAQTAQLVLRLMYLVSPAGSLAKSAVMTLLG